MLIRRDNSIDLKNTMQKKPITYDFSATQIKIGVNSHDKANFSHLKLTAAISLLFVVC
jgi:hypothetical protein